MLCMTSLNHEVMPSRIRCSTPNNPNSESCCAAIPRRVRGKADVDAGRFGSFPLLCGFPVRSPLGV